MVNLNPDPDLDLRVPNLSPRGNHATRYIAIALFVLLALVSALFPDVLTVPGPSPVTAPPTPLTP